MRITGSDQDSTPREGTRRESDRAERFRRSRRVGETLRGFVRQWEPSGLAWVEIGEELLLARLPSDIPEGQEIFFRVERLVPEITLQRLSAPTEETDDPAAANPPRPRRLRLRV